MKKLNKLHINSDKLIKNEELLTLKGGQDLCCYYNNCVYEGYMFGASGYLDCQSLCGEIGCTGDWKC